LIRRRVVVLVMSLISLLLMGLGLYLGQQAAFSGMGMDPGAYRAMEQELPVLRSQLAAARDDLAVQSARNEVDRAALELVRKELARQKEHISGLEEGLRFYRSLMAPEAITHGLSLRPIELVDKGERKYDYRIVAQQEARKHTTLKGELYVEISGLKDGEMVSYPLANLSQQLDNNLVTLRFRYFQSIEGELTLPEDFEPKSVDMVATSSSPVKAEVREQFPWHINERFTHVGK
jgi:hypothetical protein